MASIGLQINHSTAGTDIGAALAKALMPNVGDEVSIQRLKMDMETEELRRRLLGEQSSLVTQQTIEQWKKNQILQDQKNANEAAAAGALKRVEESLRQRQQQTEAPVVVPDTVLQSGGRGMPEVLTGSYYPPAEPAAAPPAPPAPPAPEVTTQPSYGQEPDWQYRVNQFPIRADEPPVPIELPPDFTGPMTNAPVAAMPGLGGQPMLPEPGGVPPIDSNTPLIGGGRPPPSRSVGAPASTPMPDWMRSIFQPVEAAPEAAPVITPDTPLIGGGRPLPSRSVGAPASTPMPDWLQNLLGGSEPPVPVEAPLPPAGTLGGLQLPPDAPVPIETGAPPVTAPVINPLTPEAPPAPPEPPIAVGEQQVITMPGRPPVSGETTAATPAAVAPAVAETPAVPPTPAQPQRVEDLPAPSTLTIKGTGDGKNDTATTVETKRGTMDRAGLEAEIRSVYLSGGSPEAIQQAIQRIEGDYGITYNPDVGVGKGKDLNATIAAYTRATGNVPGRESLLGTDEAIRYARETGDIKTTMIADRAYTLSKTPDGRTVATLVEGQPPPKKASRFGESAEGYMRTGVSDLMVNKPDPKTWDATERQDFSIMVDALYGAKVTVSENGKITVISGKLPEGVLPGSAGFNANNPPPPTVAETPPAGTQAAPAAPAPGSTAPAPVSTAPAPAGQQPAVEGGRSTEMINGVQVKNYGGWLRTGEQPKQTTSDTPAGQVTQIESTGPTDMDEQVGKEFGYTKNVLTPGKYMLDITSDNVPELSGQAISAITSGSSLLQMLGSTALTSEEREYFKNVQRFINAVTHKSSGADVTAADLRTYSYLYSLPPREVVSARDLRDFKNSVIEDIKNSRTGWNGRVPSTQLREFDLDLARRGFDLDKVYTDADAGLVEHFDVEEK